MSEQEKQKVPEPGCLGGGCLVLVATLMMVPILPCLAVLEKEKNGAQWGVLLVVVFLGIAYAVAYSQFWPTLYRWFFQPGEAEPSSEPSWPFTPQPESRARKADDEFPWEAFAYGYLMHELLDDDSGEEAEDSTWGGDDYEADDLGTEDFDGGEEFWFYEDF